MICLVGIDVDDCQVVMRSNCKYVCMESTIFHGLVRGVMIWFHCLVGEEGDKFWSDVDCVVIGGGMIEKVMVVRMGWVAHVRVWFLDGDDVRGMRREGEDVRVEKACVCVPGGDG